MIKLSDRLQLMADQIKKGETMADIGTDHGFLPLYLWEQEISPKVIMCDISEPSLQKARDAAAQLIANTGRADEGLLFRAGDGLQVLETAEADAVTIAGMGGVLMTEILEEDMDKTLSFRKYIMQPRNHSGILRHWLYENGFEITSNRLVREGRFICEVITAFAPENPVKRQAAASVDDPSWEFPDEMNAEPLAREYAGRLVNREEKILRGMQQGSDVPEEEMTIIAERLEYFKRYI